MYNPITTGIYPIHPNILGFIADVMSRRIRNLGNIDYILTFEAMGIHIATALSLSINKPFIIARKKRYSEDMIEVDREGDKLYITKEIADKDILIVDSILSTGKTIISTVKTLKNLGVNLKGVYIVVERVDQGGCQAIKKELGLEPWSLVKISVNETGVKIIDINM